MPTVAAIVRQGTSDHERPEDGSGPFVPPSTTPRTGPVGPDWSGIRPCYQVSPIGSRAGLAVAPPGYRPAMFGPRSLSRALIAAPFIVGGINALRAPAKMVPAAVDVGVPIAEQVGLPTDPELLVKINAGVQIGAGAMLVLGIWPRVASLALAASLVPTTIAGHRFW